MFEGFRGIATAKKSTTLEAVVTRADGSVENLGIISIDGKPATLFRKLAHYIKTWR